ncbi:TPA: nucleotidyltransferase family protein, partial [Candidatus Bathyarchaeota archaeon]|nr:nucleotidyltransferase family protein [Candidatus Bathyarchaeota archaeon]
MCATLEQTRSFKIPLCRHTLIQQMRAVILAAGKGERLYPLTLTTPKPLLPVGGKPLVDHLLCSLREVGIKEALLVVHHLADQIKAYLGDTRSGVDLRYEVQKEVLGTADALSSAELYVGDEPF